MHLLGSCAILRISPTFNYILSPYFSAICQIEKVGSGGKKERTLLKVCLSLDDSSAAASTGYMYAGIEVGERWLICKIVCLSDLVPTSLHEKDYALYLSYLKYRLDRKTITGMETANHL
jgi:hypothetical protein